MANNTEQETPDVIGEIYDIYSQIHYEELSDDEFKDAILALIEAEATRRELEARIDELDKVGEWPGSSAIGNEYEDRIAELKRQAEGGK